MPEVSRALLLPDLSLYPPGLKTLALSWDEIEIPLYPEEYGKWFSDRGDATVHALADAGVLRFVEITPDKDPFLLATAREKFRLGTEWNRHPDVDDPSGLPSDAVRAIVQARGDRVADVITAGVRHALHYSARKALAPIGLSPFAQIAAALPEAIPGLPEREAALISISVNGVYIDPETPIEDVLRFREKEAALLGRLRASLIDLRGQIDEAQTTEAIFNQAEAVVKNRVEPALSDLDQALRARKIAFIWRSLIGVAGIAVSGPSPVHGLGRSAQAFGQAIHYAFDREALVREHPFGYLHLARTTLGSDAGGEAGLFRGRRRPIEDPTAELRGLFREITTAVVEHLESHRSEVERFVSVPAPEMRSFMGTFTDEELQALDEVLRHTRIDQRQP